MGAYIRRTAEQWQSLIGDQHESGLSAPEFCKQNNIGYASFCQWRKRLVEPTPSPATFVALEPPMQPHQSPWAVELQIGPDIVLRITKQ
jgi:hypothetical protein